MPISLRNVTQSSLQGPTGPNGPTGNLVTITGITVTNSSWTATGETAVNTTGGYIVISGNNFQAGCEVIIGNVSATSVTVVNSSTLRCQVSSQSLGVYHVYVINPDNTVAIGLPGVTFSGPPEWATTSPLNQANVDFAFSRQLTATGATSYALAAGSSLPAGVTLSSGGLLSGTVTGISVATTYSFEVVATDAENQTASRTFSITISVVPSYIPVGAGYNQDGQMGISPATTSFATTFTSFGIDKAMIDMDSSGTSWVGIDNVGGDRGRLWWMGGWSGGTWPIGPSVGIWSYSSPIQVGSSQNWLKVTGCGSEYGGIGGGIMAANSSDTFGAIFRWGQDPFTSGGTALLRSSPIQVGSETDWIDVACGTNSMIALKTRPGTVYGVGVYPGNDTTGTYNTWSPVTTVGGIGTSVVQIRAAGYADKIALNSSGNLFYWGQNSVGPMGAGAGNSFLYPVQIATGVSTANNYTCDLADQTGVFVKANGTLWAWGTYATPGVGNVSSPIQIGSDTDWSSCWCNQWHYFAQKTDGTLYGWGYNNFNQFGLNTEAQISSPTLLGNQTTWAKIIGSKNWTAAFR